MRGVTDAPGLRSSEVARLVGISYRQLWYWCDLGLLGPSKRGVGSGVHLRFSDDEVRTLRVVSLLRDQGLPLDICRHALSLARENDGCRWLVVRRSDAEHVEVAVVASGEVEAALFGGSGTVVDLHAELAVAEVAGVAS